MPSFTYLTAALALTGAVIASPVEKRDAFEVKQVAHGLHRKNGQHSRISSIENDTNDIFRSRPDR